MAQFWNYNIFCIKLDTARLDLLNMRWRRLSKHALKYIDNIFIRITKSMFCYKRTQVHSTYFFWESYKQENILRMTLRVHCGNFNKHLNNLKITMNLTICERDYVYVILKVIPVIRFTIMIKVTRRKSEISLVIT